MCRQGFPLGITTGYYCNHSRSYPCSFFSVLPGIIRCAGRAFPSALPQAITVIIPGRIHVVSSPFYLVLSDAGRAFPSALPQAITVIIPGRIHVVSSPFYLILSDCRPSALPQAITVIIPGRIHVVSSPFYLILSDVPAGLSPQHYHRLLL